MTHRERVLRGLRTVGPFTKWCPISSDMKASGVSLPWITEHVIKKGREGSQTSGCLLGSALEVG